MTEVLGIIAVLLLLLNLFILLWICLFRTRSKSSNPAGPTTQTNLESVVVVSEKEDLTVPPYAGTEPVVTSTFSPDFTFITKRLTDNALYDNNAPGADDDGDNRDDNNGGHDDDDNSTGEGEDNMYDSTSAGLDNQGFSGDDGTGINVGASTSDAQSETGDGVTLLKL